MVRQFTFNLYFHCCYRCLLKILHVNKDVSSAFLFRALRPAKHKRRWGHNLQGAHFYRCSDYFTENTIWSCKLWQNNDVLLKHPSLSGNIRKRSISIIQTTDYSKGFLRSLALRIIEDWLYYKSTVTKQIYRYEYERNYVTSLWLCAKHYTVFVFVCVCDFFF